MLSFSREMIIRFCVIGGAFLALGFFGGFVVKGVFVPAPDTSSEVIKDFYATEVAVHVSPHGLRGKIDKGDTSFVLVDVRSAEEYEKEHIIGAINIPAYKNKSTAYGLHSSDEETKAIVSAFRNLGSDKDIVVYCYSAACMTGRKVGNILAQEGIFVKTLNIGWNEWRYFWNTWNHEHEWDATKVEDYTASGKEPGAFKGAPTKTQCDTVMGAGC